MVYGTDHGITITCANDRQELLVTRGTHRLDAGGVVGGCPVVKHRPGARREPLRGRTVTEGKGRLLKLTTSSQKLHILMVKICNFCLQRRQKNVLSV